MPEAPTTGNLTRGLKYVPRGTTELINARRWLNLSAVRIVTWNVNGLRAVAKKGALSGLDELAPDVLCFQEIKANESQIDALDLFPEFPYRYLHPADRPGYSGTAIFSKYAFERFDEFSPDALIEPQEGRVGSADFGQFYLVNVYTPNSGGELARLDFRSATWDPEFCAFIDRLKQQKPVIVCGDLNVAHQPIDLSHPEQNVGFAGFTDEERMGFSRYLAHGWIDVFRYFYPDATECYTWWSYRSGARQRNIGWRIDYFLASEDMLPHLKNITICAQCLGSDHAPILLETDL